MSTSRRMSKFTRPFAVLAGLALLGAGFAVPAVADEPDDGAVVGPQDADDSGEGAHGEPDAAAADDPVNVSPLFAEVESAWISEIHYAGNDAVDFIEISAEPGRDVSGWVVGSITRGTGPQNAAHVVTLPSGTAIPESGALAVSVPITNSHADGYGSSAFVTTSSAADAEIIGFWTIGERPGGVGSTAGSSSLLPAAVRGLTASPTGVTGTATNSVQWNGEAWVVATPTPGALNDNGLGGQPIVPVQPPEPPEAVEVSIAEAWAEPNGTLVTTRGVVTAHYPEGGFSGFVIQTEGTGGDTDLDERQVSDALFVYSPNGLGSVELGDFVQVTGARGVFNGLHQISHNPSATGHALSVLTEEADAVVPVPDFVLPASDDDRLAFQNMLVHPADRYVVSDTYNLGGWGTNVRYGSIRLGLDGPLVQESELIDPYVDPAGHAELVAANEARVVTLDDGRSATTAWDADVPYLTGEPNVRTGVELTFNQPVIVDYRFQWNFQPTSPWTVDGQDVVTFDGGDTREANATPSEVGGDVTLAIFNVLNYFTTLGVDQPACTSYPHPPTPITVNNCSDPNPGPRGAWDQANLDNQQGKIVTAINELDADVVALQEIENSAHFNDDGDRDESLAILVDALNDDAGAGVWAYAPSPQDVPGLGDDDVIRNAFIYQTDAVELGDTAEILLGDDAYSNAREPLAQSFTVPGSDYEFLAVVNHFKSKSCTGYDGTDIGAGCWNGDRVNQAESLVDFADELASEAGIEDTFLVGDFNSYAAEAPLRVFEGEGYSNVNEAWNPEDGPFTADNTYVFSGRVGSLDHIFASETATERITGTEVWSINANESVLAEYSRVGYFGSTHFEAGIPFRASDHDPVIIGIDVPEDEEPVEEIVDLTVLSFNDLHGRIGSNADVVGEPSRASVMACMVSDYRDANPNTLLVSAGDNIGASTFTSFIDQDFPTLDVLNDLGLDASAFGNHEFDQGQSDVDERVIPYSDFPWIAANIVDADGELVYDPYVIVESGGLNVAFIGGVTEETPDVVMPSGVENLTFLPIDDAINDFAADLSASGEADVIIAVVHEGFPGTSLEGMEDTFLGELVFNADESINAVIGGHSHRAYTHDVDGMWVTQTGQYGENLGVLELSVDTATGDVTASGAENVPVNVPGAVDGEDWDPGCELGVQVQTTVDEARDYADELGSEVIGEATDAYNRAQNANGSENRGGESTIGGLVADAQLWYAQQRNDGVQIAFTNSGGLRDDLSAGDITYRDAAIIQPFANTLVTIEVTGAELTQVLEEQWRADEFSKIAQSSGFRYLYDPTAEPGERITDVYLEGEPIQADEVYTVVVNSYMADGGGGMDTLAAGSNITDTGLSDLEAMVEYIRDQEVITPDFTQRAVGITWISDPDAVYIPGDEIAIDLSSFSYSTDEPKSDVVSTSLGGLGTGEFDLDNEPVDGTDEVGQAQIRVTVPQALAIADMTSGGVGRFQTNGAAESEPAVFAFEITDPLNGTVLAVPVSVVTSTDPDPTDPGPDPTDPGPDPTVPTDPGSGGPGDADPGSGTPGGLPGTGASVTWLVIGALVLLVLGGGFLTVRRRRHSR